MSNIEERKQSMRKNKTRILASISPACPSDNKPQPIHCFYIGNDRKIDKRISKQKSDAFQSTNIPKNFLSPDQFIDSLIDKIDFKTDEKQKSISDIVSCLKKYKLKIGMAIDSMETTLKEIIKPYDFAGKFLEQLANDAFKNNKPGLQIELDKACEFLAQSKIDTFDFNKSFENRMKVVQDIFKIQLNAVAEDITNDVNEYAQNLDKKKDNLIQEYFEKGMKELLKKNEVLEAKLEQIEAEKKTIENKFNEKFKTLENQHQQQINDLKKEMGNANKPHEAQFGEVFVEFINMREEQKLTNEVMETLKNKIKDLENQNKVLGSSLVQNLKPNPISNQQIQVVQPIQNVGPSRVLRPKFTGNPAEDLDMLVKISKDVKSNDKLFLNFNRYKIANYIPHLKDIAYDKSSLGKVVKMVVELSGKAGQVNFDYSNSELQIDECNQLAQLQKQHPQNVYLYYNKTIQTNFSPGNFSHYFNQLNTQLTQLTPSHLVYLHLDAWNSGFGYNKAQKIATTLNSIQNLSRLYLNLSNNIIQTEGAIQIAQALQKSHLLSNLFLDFGGNKIKGEGAKQISAGLQKNTNISSLELSFGDTEIGNDGASDIAQAFKMLPNLTNLVFGLTGNNLNDTGATAIAKALTTFAHSPTFTLNLYLNANQIGDAGATQIAKVLATFKGLSHLLLWLQYNKIGNAGAIEIASALKNLKGLSYLELYLNDNNYTEETKKHLKELKANLLEFQKTQEEMKMKKNVNNLFDLN